MKNKTVVTITGIRPDFIRMSEIFRLFDENFHHIMVHTGQHYDDELSRIFFKDLNIRSPDYTLETGINSRTHYEQLSYLSKAIFELFKNKNIKPDLIVFLGDSNSAMISAPLFKEGYKIAHIEGGMRSYDRRMPEEVNRVICDYVSDLVFVYTPLYKERLIAENKPSDHVFVVGNTITEILQKFGPRGPKSGGYIVADIHRSENLKTPEQYKHILTFTNELGKKKNRKVKLVRFARGVKMIEEGQLLKNLDMIELVGPFGFLDYLKLQYNADFVISDSGTAQEECPLLGVPVIVPRNKTERPESLENGNSILVGETLPISEMIGMSEKFLSSYSISPKQVAWLGDGTTARQITEHIVESFKKNGASA
jgi:UDP-N-acetylglucosamine 2-epimerase